MILASKEKKLYMKVNINYKFLSRVRLLVIMYSGPEGSEKED